MLDVDYAAERLVQAPSEKDAKGDDKDHGEDDGVRVLHIEGRWCVEDPDRLWVGPSGDFGWLSSGPCIIRGYRMGEVESVPEELNGRGAARNLVGLS
jgi:hypothetical protein